MPGSGVSSQFSFSYLRAVRRMLQAIEEPTSQRWIRARAMATQTKAYAQNSQQVQVAERLVDLINDITPRS